MRKTRILKLTTERIYLCDSIEIAIESKNVQYCRECADCDAHAPLLDAP